MNVRRKAVEILYSEHPLRRLTALVIGRSGLGRLLRMKIRIQDFHIFFHPAGLCSAYWYDPNARSEDYEFLSSFLKEGDVYVDVGANIGVTVIPAGKSVGETGKVIAFEPHPTTCSYLKENIELNRLNNVQINNCAVGNQIGYIYFTSQFTDEKNQISNTPENSIKVPIVRLDDFLQGWDHIDLLKLDIEGYEKHAIEGAGEVLKRVNCVYFELSEENLSAFGFKPSDILVLIEQSGFAIFKRNSREENLFPIDSTYIPLPNSCENLFGIRDIRDFQNRTQWGLEPR